MCPTSKNLAQKKQQKDVREGENVKLYERMMMFMDNPEILGLVMCEEMKV